jgi:hypothetical protein
MVWVGALTAAAGGAYWYSTTTSKGAAEKQKAEARAREMKAKADVKVDEGKMKANELKVGVHRLPPVLITLTLNLTLGRGSCEIRRFESPSRTEISRRKG